MSSFNVPLLGDRGPHRRQGASAVGHLVPTHGGKRRCESDITSKSALIASEYFELSGLQLHAARYSDHPQVIQL